MLTHYSNSDEIQLVFALSDPGMTTRYVALEASTPTITLSRRLNQTQSSELE
jgi:hypothetical protein